MEGVGEIRWKTAGTRRVCSIVPTMLGNTLGIALEQGLLAAFGVPGLLAAGSIINPNGACYFAAAPGISACFLTIAVSRAKPKVTLFSFWMQWGRARHVLLGGGSPMV